MTYIYICLYIFSPPGTHKLCDFHWTLTAFVTQRRQSPLASIGLARVEASPTADDWRHAVTVSWQTYVKYGGSREAAVASPPLLLLVMYGLRPCFAMMWSSNNALASADSVT